MFSIHPLGPHLGSACALLDCGETALLLDTGFGYCAPSALTQLRGLLGDRPLDGILLSHSHYDHVDGLSCFRDAYPDAPVLASKVAAEILRRPHALARMASLDAAAAQDDGFPPLPSLRPPVIDRTLEDGERFSLGGLSIRAVATPGHTRCSMSFFFPDLSLLCTSETTGVYADPSHLMPGMIVGYRMTLEALDRSEALAPRWIYVPHNGLLDGRQREDYFRDARKATLWTGALIRRMYAAGASEAERLDAYRARAYPAGCLQPERAFLLNARAMIDRLTAELCEA